jgi:hypothetical protein
MLFICSFYGMNPRLSGDSFHIKMDECCPGGIRKQLRINYPHLTLMDQRVYRLPSIVDFRL